MTVMAGVDGLEVFMVLLIGNEIDGFGWTFDLIGNFDHVEGAG